MTKTLNINGRWLPFLCYHKSSVMLLNYLSFVLLNSLNLLPHGFCSPFHNCAQSRRREIVRRWGLGLLIRSFMQTYMLWKPKIVCMKWAGSWHLSFFWILRSLLLTYKERLLHVLKLWRAYTNITILELFGKQIQTSFSAEQRIKDVCCPGAVMRTSLQGYSKPKICSYS